MNSFPNPLNIDLGMGRIQLNAFKGVDGFGVCLRDTGEYHEVGTSAGPIIEEPRLPESGEVYITCQNKESALVLLEVVQGVVDLFELEKLDVEEATT